MKNRSRARLTMNFDHNNNETFLSLEMNKTEKWNKNEATKLQ